MGHIMGGAKIGFLYKCCVFSAIVVVQASSFAIGNDLIDIRRSRMTGDVPGPHAENRFGRIKRTTTELERYRPRSFLGQSMRPEDQPKNKLERRCDHCLGSESRMRTAICAKCRRLLRRNQDEEPRSLPPPLQRAQNKVLAKLLTNDAFRRRIKSSSSLFKHSLVSPPNVSFEEAKNPIVPGDQRSGRKHSTKRKQRNRDSKTGAGDENKQHGNRQTMSDDTHHHLSIGIAKNDFAIGNSDANDDIEKGRVFEESDSGDKSTSSVLRSDEDDSSKDYDWELWENCPLLLAVNEYNRVIPDEIEEKCKDLLSSKSKVSSSRKLPGTGRSAENPRCARVTKKSKLNNLKAPLSKVCPIIGEHSLDPAVPNIDLDKKYADVRKNISEETVSSRKIPDESLMLEISNKQDKNDDSHLLLSITKQEPKENVTSALLPNFIRNNIDGNEDLDAFVKKLVQNFKQSKNDPLSKINITEDLLKDEALMEKLNLLGDAKVQLLIRNIDDVREEDDRKRKTHSDEHVTNVNKEDAPRASEVTLENPRNLRTKRSTSNFDEFGYVEDENSAENHDFSNELELLQDGIRGNVVQGTDARREFIRNSENEMISLEQPKVELPTPNVSGLLRKLKQQNQQEVSRNGNRFSSSYSVEKDKAAQVTSLLKNILRKTQETDIPDRNLDTRAINLERLKKYVEDDGQVASRAHEKNIKKGKIENVTSETSTTLYVTEKATDTTAKDALLKKQLCKDKEFAKINPQLCGDNNKHAEKPHASKLEMPSLLKDFGEGIKTMVTDETRLAKDKIVPELKKTLEEIKDIPRSTLGKIIPQVEKNLKELRSNVRTRTEDLSLDELLPKFKSGISDFLEDEKNLITNKFTEAKEAATDLAKRGQDTFIGKVLDNLKPLKEANPHENIERLLKKANINLEKNSSDDARETVLEQTKTMQEIMNNPELVQNILKELQKPVNGENILGAKNEAEAESFIESNLRAGQSIEELLGASKNEENVSSVLSKTQKMGGHLNQSRNQHEVTNRTNQRVEQTIRSENVLKETQRGPKGDRIKQRLLEVLHNNSLFKISNETISELRDEILHAINEPFIRYELCHKYRGLDESPNLDDEHIVTQPEETIKMPENEPGDDATSGTNIVREKSPPDTDEDSPLIDAPKDETPKKNKLKMFKKKTPKKSPDLTEEDDGSGSQKALGGGRKELALPVDENEESIKTTTEDNVANPIIFQPSELVDETSENPEVGEPKNEETENKEKTKIAEKAPDTKLTSGSQNEDLPEGPELGLEEKTSDITAENVSSKALIPSADKEESIVSSSRDDSNTEGLLVLGDKIKIPIMLKKNEDGNLEIALNSKKMCSETCGNISDACDCPCHHKTPVVGLNEPRLINDESTGMSKLTHEYDELYEYLKTLNEEELKRILHESRGTVGLNAERSSERRGRHIQNYNERERGVNNARSSEQNAGENQIMKPVNNVVTFVANELLNEMLQSKTSDCRTDDRLKMRIFGSLLNWIGGNVAERR